MSIEYNSDGIITQSITEILDEREENLKLALGEDFVIDKTTPIGNMELADANSELTIQELIAWLIPNQLDANTAVGTFLDAICELSRCYRREPQYTTLYLKITGTSGTIIYSGDLTVSDGNDVYYTLYEDCTISDEGNVLAKFKCDEYGDNVPPTESEINILTPIVGVENVSIDTENLNLSVGRYAETDDELRRRRKLTVEHTAMTTSGALTASLYNVEGVTHVKYFENYTESTDSNNLPAKSFEYVVQGGDEDDITEEIFLNKPIGTRAYGTTVVTKYDSEGNSYSIGFTKAEEVNIGINIIVQANTDDTNTWKSKVKTAILEKFNDIQGISDNVKGYNYYAVLTSFEEVTDITSIEFYNVSDPDTKYQTYPIGNKQIAILSTDNIDITIGE